MHHEVNLSCAVDEIKCNEFVTIREGLNPPSGGVSLAAAEKHVDC